MKPDTSIQLGDFQFASFEVPEEIAFGGAHATSIQKLVGGKRVVDAMGPDPRPLEWSGIFVGETALDRALYVKGLLEAGTALDLSWDKLLYRVLIVEFECRFQRFYRLPYRIVLEVVEDLTSPVTTIAAPNVDSLVASDADGGQMLVDRLGIPALSSAYVTVKAATEAVSDFATATSEQINAILVPVAEVRRQVNTLLAAAGNTIQNVTTVGGILPNTPIAQQAARLTSQINAVNHSADLAQLDAVLGRLSSNVGNANSSSKSITIAGGNLYRIAAEQYGNAMGWTSLAKANKLNDPQVQGITTLTVPPRNADTGGILRG